MTEHYTQSTEEVMVYCSKCCRVTVHKVSAGRLAHCLEHQRPVRLPRKPSTQLKLYPEDK